MIRNIGKAVLVFVLVALVIVILTSCKPPEDIYADPFPIVDDETNLANKDRTTKDEAVERATGSLENLLDYLDSEVVSTTGYYLGTEMHINTEDGSAFILRLQANMYTWPYEQYEKGTPEYDAALAKHNELIKYNDMLIEWYDGTTNTMLIGFYFDGINTDPADPGNNLYLNLQGSKRIFEKFGDTVLYQQIIRLITHLNLESLISSVSSDGSSDSALSSVEYLLKQAVTTNYKLTLNGDETSVYFNEIPLTMIAPDVTEFIQGIFAPFQDKLDPLTFKYLGFLFSTLGTAEISTLNSDMQFLMEPNETLGKEILTGMDVDFRGNSLVRKKNKITGATYAESVPFTMNIAVDYDIRVSQNILLDRENYTIYQTGCYEFIGDMYLVPLDLKLDVLLRTDMNKYDNKINKVYMAARDLATDDLIIGTFYKDELTYIDIEGLQHLYGGVKFEDIGLPKAYKGGFNLASTLKFVSDFFDKFIVMLVDSILDPNKEEGESQYSEVTNAIMKNIESTMKDEDDPTSHATIKVRIDMALIKEVMKVTSPTGTNYSTDQIIQLLNKQFNIDLEAIASILGMSVDELLNRSYVDITYDVDVYSIKIEVYSAAEKPHDAEADLILRMDLYPTHIGERVRIAFPNFDKFKELQEVMTYSGYLEGQFVFAQTEEVDLSKLLGAFMGDTSGLNTPYILPDAADIYFTLSYDQYIREQILENGRWTRKGRSAFNLYVYIVENDVSTPIIRIYANDVSFNTAYPVEELGYVWLDYICMPNLPKFKVREDLFITSLYEYMGYDFENESGDLVLGLTDIVTALMEDSWATFEPEVIRVTTSNDSIKQFFGVDELIGTISIMIGFKQRVKNIDQLEKDFAMYSVGTLEDIAGPSPYEIELHQTVPVYFDFGQRMETRDLKFLYDPESIAVISGNAYYRPRMDKQFMGSTRDYLVYITDIVGRQRVRELVEDYYEWEPLGEIPTTVGAFYGETQNIVNMYNADYNLHAIFDRDTGYYTVLSPNGYEIVYDFENNVYVMGLGSQYKYDKGYEELGEGVVVYLKEFIGANGLKHVYDLGLRIAGYYVVENDLGMNILYNFKNGQYIVSGSDYELMEEEIAEGQTERRRLVTVLLGDTAVIREYTKPYVVAKGLEFYSDSALTTIVGVTSTSVQAIYVNSNYSYFIGNGTVGVSGTKYYINTQIIPGVVTKGVEFYSITNGSDQDLTNDSRGDVFGVTTLSHQATFINATDSSFIGDGTDGALGVRYYFNTQNSRPRIYDLVTARYTVVKTGIYNGQERTIRVFYDQPNNNYIIDSSLVPMINDLAKAEWLNSARIVVDNALNYGVYPYDKIEWLAQNINNVDWDEGLYNDLVFGQMTWDDLTLEGGKFVVKVVIGEGKMATYRENVVVKVWNRTVLTDLPFININTPDGMVKAPIAMTLDIDPIMYLLYKAYYINGMRNDPETFVQWYFRNYDARIQFTKIYADPEEETPDAIGGYTWYFDFENENRIYSERQINNRVNLDENAYTYVYTNFFGQIIALRVRVLPRQLAYFMAPGEVEPNTHTIDALYPSSYYIPKNLTYYYEGQDGLEFTLDFNDLASSTIFSTKPTRMPNIGSSMSGPNYMSIINWTHPVADNVKLVNDRDEFGNPYPFKNALDNTTTSFLDFSINFDFNRDWYYEDWFYTPELKIYVDIPDKVVGTFDKELMTDDHILRNYELQNIKTQDKYITGETPSTLDINLGVHNVDPFDYSTWILPDDIIVFFTIDEATNRYQTYTYNVTWQNVEGDAVEHFVRDNEGTYYIHDVGEDPKAYYLEAIIGDEEINYITIRLLVRIMSQVATDVSFLNEDGSSLKNSLGEELVIEEALGAHEDSIQEKLYTYIVDTYERFDIPKLLTITFKDGTTRSYLVSWSDHLPWVQGTNRDIYAVIGTTQEEYKERIYLDVEIGIRTVNDLDIVRHDENVSSLTKDILGREIVIDGIRVDEDGFILDQDDVIYIPAGYSAPINVYDYFMYLFSDIDADLVDLSVHETIKITDAALSAYLPIFGSLDLQKMIVALGQGIDIYVGQDKGADDFTVYMVVTQFSPSNELEISAERDSYILMHNGSETGVVLEAYNPDNTPKYPNGFIISSGFNFTVRYKDGTSVFYSNSETGQEEVPIWWSVVKSPIIGADPEEDWMVGLKEYDKIDRLTEESIYGGGVIWLSALLSDGSRVYTRFSSSGINIGSNYGSVIGSGRYEIVQGLITINNIYDHYSLGINVIPSRLPNRLVLEGGFEISGIVWTMQVSAQYLDSINYLGTTEDVVIASARVMRETVQLKLRVLPCEVKSLSYVDSITPSRTLLSEEVDLDGNIIVNFDAYANWAYGGTIALPRALTFKYTTGIEVGRAYPYTNLEFRPVDINGTMYTRINAVGYDLFGHTETSYNLGLDPDNIRFRLTLMDGQIVNIILHFNDKTAKEYKFANIDESIDRKITLNPYSPYVTVPGEVTIKFEEGADLVYLTGWTLPGNFEVRYDTFDTILDSLPAGSKHFTATSQIAGFSGLQAQPLTLYIGVTPYVLESWSLEQGKTDYYVDDTHNTNPNSTYHMLDPYAGKTADLPSLVEDSIYHQGDLNYYLPVVWDFDDADIVAEGTPSGHILVSGWIYDKDRGQPVTIKLYIDTWNFVAIRRKQGDSYQSMMQDIRFYFSQVSGKSSYGKYQIAFNVKDVTSSADPVPRNVIFIPEDIDPTTVLIDGTSSYYAANYPYRIKWDQGALARARNALSTGGDAEGTFSLANTGAAIIRTTPNNTCYYQYETLNLTKVDMGFGYGSQNEAIYVVDPLNPYFGEGYRLPVKAKGNYNLESDVELNSKGLNVTAIFWQTGSPTIVIPDKYVGGGVYKGWAVTIRVENPSTGFSYQEIFRIMMVFLDMSPITYINNSSMNVLNRGAIKSTYNMSTYANAINPYEDSYTSSLMTTMVNRDGVTDNVLNTGLNDYNLVGATLDYTVTEWDPNILVDNNMNIQYSKKVSIRGREYTSNIVRRQYSSKFEITELNLGYGFGIDSARYDYLSSDPLAIQGKQKTRFVVSPLNVDFSVCGTPIAGEDYTFILSENRIVGSYEGTQFTPGQFNYRVTWWNPDLSGNMIFNSDVGTGGYIDHWKVILTVLDGENVQYTQVFNIILFFLDGRPVPEMIINAPQQELLIANPKTNYTLSDYEGYENPYGAYYDEALVEDLNSLAVSAHTGYAYNFEVLTWGEPNVINGFNHIYSARVRIYRVGSDPASSWVITSYKPFIHKTYAV